MEKLLCFTLLFSYDSLTFVNTLGKYFSHSRIIAVEKKISNKKFLKIGE